MTSLSTCIHIIHILNGGIMSAWLLTSVFWCLSLRWYRQVTSCWDFPCVFQMSLLPTASAWALLASMRGHYQPTASQGTPIDEGRETFFSQTNRMRQQADAQRPLRVQTPVSSACYWCFPPCWVSSWQYIVVWLLALTLNALIWFMQQIWREVKYHVYVTTTGSD